MGNPDLYLPWSAIAEYHREIAKAPCLRSERRGNCTVYWLPARRPVTGSTKPGGGIKA